MRLGEFHYGPLIIAILLGGCTGTIETNDLDVQQNGKLPGGSIKGVVVYPPALFVEVFQTTIRVDPKTGQLLAPEGQCTPVKSQQLVVRADLNRPQQIRYNSGLLESNKFGVTIADGLLTGVNSESVPDRGETITNLTGAAVSAVTTLEATVPLACNDGKVFVRLERVKFPD